MTAMTALQGNIITIYANGEKKELQIAYISSIVGPKAMAVETHNKSNFSHF